jgi:ribosomal protein L24
MEGGISSIEAPIHTSNGMLVDPQTKKGTRVGFRTDEVERDGQKPILNKTKRAIANFKLKPNQTPVAA